jgi:hypothetical protein
MTLALTGKDKAARVPLDYFRQIGRKRWIITGVVAALSGGVLLAAVGTDWWKRAASPGPVHYVHTQWENDCKVCHEPFKPTGSQSAMQGVLGVGKASDELCQKCHAGPPHHPKREIKSEVGSCSSCHTEHRGRHSSLARSPDPTCTKCHADLRAHVQSPPPHYANQITRFDRDHPEFKLGPPGDPEKRKPLGEGATDPGKLKFNHQLHLDPGQKVSWKLSNITDETLRDRYRKDQQQREGAKEPPPDSDPVKLDCASCHQLDATNAPTAGPGETLTYRSPGDYYLPVNFDRHCKACHPLTFSNQATVKPGKLVEIPHHLRPEDVRRFLMGTLIAGEQHAKAGKESEKTDRPLPGENVSLSELRAQAAGKVKETELDLFNENVEKVLQFVQKGKSTCGLCHSFQDEKKKEGDKEVVSKVIVPTNVPEVWFPHAKFSHQGHRDLTCDQCHDAKKSTKQTDVLVPGIDTCKQCHAAGKWLSNEPLVGVRHDCTTCHLYHQGEDPLGGRGTTSREGKQKRSIEELLKGR